MDLTPIGKILARQRERPLAGHFSSVSDALIPEEIDVNAGFSLFPDFQHPLPAIIPIPLRIPLILPILQGKIGSIN
ncbi:hypothetical protein P7H22_16330 [Paenibacillus larvae]|nr:hypothetical protein [Paenibacillus larvae]MDT2241603.1 hypothetical protein [Paenibacillus larvae]